MPESDPEPYAEDDLERFIAGYKGHGAFISARQIAMVTCLWDSGMRKGELAGLRIDDLAEVAEEGQKGTVLYVRLRAESVKTRAERHIRLGQRSTAAMRKYLVARAALLERKSKRRGHVKDIDWLWLSEECDPLTPNAIYQSLTREKKRLGIQTPRTVHAFRHTFGIEFLHNGGGEIALQTGYGHKTQAMTKKYVKKAANEHYLQAHRLASPVDNMKL